MMEPVSGWFDGRSHVMPLRVYFEDTDAAGIVFYAAYLKFTERARTEMLRLLGHAHAGLLASDNMAFTVRRCEADYLRPARLDEVLAVRTRLQDLGGASLDIVQDVERIGDVICRMRLKLVCMKADGRPARIPRDLRRTLFDFLEPNGI